MLGSDVSAVTDSVSLWGTRLVPINPYHPSVAHRFFAGHDPSFVDSGD